MSDHPAPSEVPPEIQAFLDATNSADTEAFVGAFTEDAFLDDWGRTFHGHDGVRSWNTTDNIGVQTRFELLAIGPGNADDEYVATIKVSGNGYNGTGPMTFTLRDGRIAELRIA